MTAQHRVVVQARTTGPSLRLCALRKTYAGACVVDIPELSIGAGSFVALVGSSGSGKSTLLRSINRLITPDTGTILLNGEDVGLAAPFQLRRRIGYVIQGVGLFPHMTVSDNIEVPLRISGRSKGERVLELLDLVALPRTFAERMPSELSGGQRQRVGVARALAASPGLMLLDEPFGALDPVTRDQIGTTYRALHDRLGITSILVTHDMAEALLLADRVIVLADGQIVGDATPGELLSGQGGDAAQRLVAVPRAQAERLSAMTR